MHAFRILAALAVLAWAASLWPGAVGRGRDWVVVDRSASMGAEFAPAALWQSAGRDAVWWQALRRRGRVRAVPPSGAEAAAGAGSPVGAALRALAPELRPGDRVLVWSDGRVTDALPDAADFPAAVEWLRPEPVPLLAAVQAPPHWDPAQDLVVRLDVLHGDVRRGAWAVRGHPAAATVLASRPESATRLTLRLRPDRPLPPDAAWQLSFRYEEDGARSTRSATVLPRSGDAPALVPVDAAAPAARTWRARLARGEVLVAAGGDADAWGALPRELRLFVLDPAPLGAPLWILLDASGSMDGGALDEARAFLHRLAAAWPRERALTVLPFRAGVLPALDLRDAAARARLDALVAFGPTQLAAALDALAGRAGPGARVVIVSDGEADAPAGGWEARVGRLPEGARVWTVPAGPDARRDVLARVGVLVEGVDLAARLRAALAGALPARARAAHAVPGASLPLPERWDGLGPAPPMRAAPGVEVLMRDDRGAAVVVARRVGDGLLLGVAAGAARVDPARLTAAARAFGADHAVAWRDGALWLRTGDRVPVVRQAGRALGAELVDRDAGSVWRVPAARPYRPLSVRLGEAPAWTLPPRGDRETTVTAARWQRWLERLRNGRTRSALRPTLLGCGLLLLTAALFARRRAQT